MFYVYILRRSDGKYYVGQTNNLAARISRHKRREVQSTKAFLPITLMHKEVYKIRSESMQREKYIKSLKSARKIEEIISNSGGLIV